MNYRTIGLRDRFSSLPCFLFLMCFLAVFTRIAMANPVIIQDASFDSRALALGGKSNTLTPWQKTGGIEDTNGWIERVSDFAADGQNHLGVNSGHSVWQDLGVTYQPNTVYTLTVAVGNRSPYTFTDSQSRYVLSTSDGTNLFASNFSASVFLPGTFQDAPPLIFKTIGNSAAIGKTIRVRLESLGSGRCHFDSVRLTAVPIQPPEAKTLAATGVTQTSATLNGTVNPLGRTANVTFEYGRTNAYGSTATTTPASVSGSASTAVTAKLSGLEGDIDYHYRLAVTTGGVTTYSSGATFTTAQPARLSLTPPTVAITVPSGESAGGNLTVQNSGLDAGGWSLEVVDANGRGDNMAGALAAVLASGTSLNAPLPNRFDFSQGESGTSIPDGGTGGTSLFSNGNLLSTSLGGPIAYSDGKVSTATSLGTGGSYFTKKLPGLFIFGADLNGPSWFEVNGYIYYSSGPRQTSEFSITRNGRRWSAFVAKTPDYWRTINHLILVDQGGLTATTGTSTSDQKHRISGLTGKRKVFHLLYVTSTPAIQPDSVFENLAGRLLDAIPIPFSSVFATVPSTGFTNAGENSPATLRANAQGIAPGSYPFQVRGKGETGLVFGSAQGTLEVTAPRLSVPSDIFRAGPVGLAPFVADVSVTSNHSIPQSWSATLPGLPTWLALDTPSGTTPSPLKLRFTPGTLPPGNYSTTLQITSNGAIFEIPVRLTTTPLSIRKFLPDPRRPVVYAINQNGKDAGEVLEISTVSKSITRSVRVGKEPSDLDLTENGNQLVVMNTSGPSLSVVDLASFSVTETIPLTEFSNRNEDVGGHVKCGKGSIVYYVDEQWGPRLRVFNTATKTVLQTFGADIGTSPNTTNNSGYGDINLNPNRSSLFGWVQYGDGAGWVGTGVVRFTIGQDGRLSGFAKSADYYQYDSKFGREPFDTPVLFNRDGSKLVIKDRVVDQENLDSYPLLYPNVIYSMSPGGEIAVSSTAIYAGEGGEVLHNLPVTSTVQTVLPDYSSLIYFNSTTKSIGWLDLPGTLGLARLGLELTPADGSTVALPSRLKWLPVTGVTRYQVYLGTNRSDVENATTSSGLYLGLANGNEMALAGGLTIGQTYYWRVVTVDSSGAPIGIGTVYSFNVSSMTLSRSTIAAETVQGVTTHVETIQLESTVPQAWTATESTAWIKSVTASGTTPGTLTVVMDASGLTAGNYQGSVTVTSASSQVVVPVSLRVYAANYVIAEADLDKPYVYLVSQADVNSSQPSFLLRLNTATDKIESALRCGSGVTDLAVHYLENRIYLTNWKTGVLRAYDRATLAQVQTYQFSPAGATGYGNGDAYVVAAGRGGRIMVEEQDQWIDSWLVDTATGKKLATFSSREGGGLFEPTGRYYYHGENNSSGAVIGKHDTNGDKITAVTTKRVESYSYHGSRLVAMSGDGSRVFWNGGVFDSNLNVLMQLKEEVISSTYRGELIFTNTKAINGSNSQTLATLPMDTKVQAVSGDQRKLFLFKNAAVSVVDIATLASVPPRGLVPGIANGSTVIGTSQELTWSQEAAALSYDVYFGTKSAVTGATKTSPEFLGNVTGTRWTGILPELALGGQYYWRVDLNGFSSVTKGNVWLFQIAQVDVSPRAVKLAAPAGSPVLRQSLAITAGAATAWTASTTTPWINLRSTSGTTPDALQFDINTTGLAVGTKNGSITLQVAGKSFTVPIELSVVTLNVTKLITHPNRPVVYAINTSLTGEGFCHLLEINPATAAIQRTLPIGFAPTDADLDPVTERLYVSNWGYSQTRVIDVSAWAELPALNLGENIYKLEITPNGRLVTEGQNQWIQLNMWNAVSGINLASNSSPYFNVREGDGQADPTGAFYYRCDNNTSGATVQKFNISANSFVQTVLGPQIGYGSRNLILSGDGKRLFWLGRTLDENLNLLATMPTNAEVHATNSSGELAIGESAVWWSDSGTQFAALPFASTVATVSSNDAHLVRFNATTRTLHSTAIASLTELPGPNPRPGQILNESPQRLSWSPVNGATSYRVFIAADATALQAMTAPTATVVTNFYDLPAPLVSGRAYSWRVNAVKDSGEVAGKVQSFIVRFPQGPQLAMTRSDSGANVVSFAQGKLLLGWGEYSSGAQVFDFDTATGSTRAIQSFVLPGYYGDHYFGSSVAMDQGKAFVGAYARDNPANNGGNVFSYRPETGGYWEQQDILAPPAPVVGENFGQKIAAAGNLMLAGTGNTYNLAGRVAAYLTEPSVVRTQVLSASDGAIGDGFGSVIAMDGNRAIISALARGSSYNRIPCLYAFTRSTSTGLWTQTQKITIPGATSSSNSGIALALSETTMAVNVSSTAVAIFTESKTNQWTHSVTINSSTVTGTSPSFGVSLALHGDQLFIGDPYATYLGISGGAVFSFRRNGSAWVAGPVITPVAARSNFGRGIAVREGWLVVTGDTDRRPASVFRIEQTANKIPWFTNGVPSQLVAARAFSIPLTVTDADGNAGLTITKLQGPPWLALSDQGNGSALLTGTPVGASGSTHDAQFEVQDGKGGRSLWTTRITLLASTTLPKLVQEPAAADLGVGQEFVLRAAVSGIGPFQWQWYLDGNAIPGASRDTLVIGEVKDTDAGRYQVRVSNVVGEVASSEVLLTVHPTNRDGGDWPTFGGSPSHTGRHPAVLAGLHFHPAWNSEVQVGYVLNRAAIANGRAVVVPQSRLAENINVRGLDLKTGASLWAFPVPSSNSTNPPSIYQNKIYFQRGKGLTSGDTPQLYSLNATTGQQLWSSTFGAQWQNYEAPAVGDAGIFINGGPYGGMSGFNFSGSERFFHTLAQYDGWTPTLANGRLFSWVAGVFTEHNPNDGNLLWSINSGWDWRGWSMNTVSAVSGNSAAFISTTELLCVDLPTRSIRWRVPAGYHGSPAIADGRVFAIQGNAVRSYALADGSPGRVYQTSAGMSYDDALVDQPIVFNDRLIISSETKTWVFDLQTGALLQTLNAGGRLSYSNGYLLAAGNNGVLRAFEARSFNSKLAALTLNSGKILPEFDSLTTRYNATILFDMETVTLTPTTDHPAATVKVNGASSTNGAASPSISLNVGENEIQTLVTAEDGITTMTYTVVITRLPRDFVFNSAADIPLTADGFSTGDFPVNIILNYAPVPGTTLTMVNNTSLGFMHGRFSNLTHGQRIWLSHSGEMYPFVANYHGGTSNDLVLQWAGTKLAAWGMNNYGQLGDGGNTQRLAPVAVDDTGILTDKTIFALATGYLHSVALCSDGTLASWGYNVQGQLGDKGSAHQSVPVAVDISGALSGKVVVAISSGSYHNLALCSDGTIAAWGFNNHGQLGDGTKTTARAPVMVNMDGVLAGKQVVAVAAGAYQSYALCSDGTLTAWGYNDEGELGNGSNTGSLVPTAVDINGALAGRKVSNITAGQYHVLALCTDGTVVSWGYNQRGQLGNSTTADSRSPIAIGSFGALSGKSAMAIAAGASHSIALCTDGTLAAWGFNSQNQLGVAGITQSTTPVAFATSTLPLAALTTGAHHNLLRSTDGSLTAWGSNSNGQLGSNTTQASPTLVSVDTSTLSHGSFTIFATSGCASSHSLAVFAAPMAKPTGLEAWRLENFGDIGTANPLASECGDCDRDGIPNLVEYAFGLDPRTDCEGVLPQPQIMEDRFELCYRLTQTLPDIKYGAEWSPDLSPGSWRDVPNTGTDGEHIFSLSRSANPSVFIRHKVQVKK